VTETLEIAGALEATDEMLMKEISRRRQGALVELYGRHGQRLRTTVESVLREGADADDILQEIFLQIWKEADHYSPKDGRPLGWLITIARRRAIDRLRRCQAYYRARERYREDLQEQRRATRREDDTVVLNDLHHFLKKCMEALPKFQREAVELAFFKGLSHTEIAAATRARLGTVKTRVELGVQKLTHALRPQRCKV